MNQICILNPLFCAIPCFHEVSYNLMEGTFIE